MTNKRKTRMYEPWGYQDENNYKSTEIMVENDFDAFLVDTSYNKDDNKIYFTNKDGEVKASLDVNEFVKSDSIIDHTEYKDGILKIYFTNGDVVTIDLTELLDENEFKDGLIVDDHVVKVLIDGESDDYLSVSENGVKVAGVKADIEAEEARAISAETALDEKIDAEIARATAEEQRIDAKLDQEISDRIADVDAEETRATDEETTIKNTIGGGFSTASTETVTAKFNALSTALDTEIGNRTTQDNQLQNNINTESTARQAADTRLENLITDERNRAKAAEEALDAKIDQEIADREADVDAEEARAISAETALQGAIDAETTRAQEAETALQASIEAEGQRAQDAETALDAKIDDAVSALTDAIAAEENRAGAAEAELEDAINNLGRNKFDNAVYDSSAKTINFLAEDIVVASIDATDFVKDGMIDDVKIENGKLVIVFNTDSGKESIEIPITDIFNPDNYYDKNDIDGIVSGINESISNEAATRAENDEALSQSIDGEKTRAEGAELSLQGSIDAEAARAISAETDLQSAIDLKADKETTYTQTEVDALIKAKETEIYNLTKLVGEIGGKVTYTYPNELGTSLTSLLGNYGTVKLAEDATISRFGPGVTAKNKVTLNLNNHSLTSTSAGSYGAIMARGTQEITIGGKGTIDAGNGICIEANGTSSLSPLATFNLTGSTTVYRNNNPGGELIYCYVGIINITNGTFRNDGGSEYMLNCYDANYAAGTAKIIVTGGKFYDFNPADNSAEGEHTNFLAEGYHVETSTVVEEGVEHTVYTVKKD